MRCVSSICNSQAGLNTKCSMHNPKSFPYRRTKNEQHKQNLINLTDFRGNILFEALHSVEFAGKFAGFTCTPNIDEYRMNFHRCSHKV